MKSYFSTLFILITTTFYSVIGQTNNEKFFSWQTIENHLEIGVGYAHPYLKDASTSPLLHTGSGTQANFNYFLINDNFYTSAEVYGNFALLGNKFESADENPLRAIFLDVNIDAGLKVYEFNKVYFYPGIKINYNNHQWSKNIYSNSAYQYNTSLFTGLHLYAERPVYFKGNIRTINDKQYKYPPDLKFSFDFSLPLIGGYVKPMYHGFSDIVDPGAQAVSSDSLVHGASIFKGMLIIETRLNADYLLKNGNSLRLTYWWKFHEFKNESYLYQYAIQGISFAFIFRLDKNIERIETIK